jgi:hypothetical protein|tara:strand:- start:214 stop:930 length:717 start_codon:yes stop_codon:yes gene_type:complete
MLKRQEYKYFISQNEIHILRRSLKKFMKIDENSNKINSSYTVTSLYFDTPYESNFNEKVDGIISREKFRIRKYSTSDIIKFESKKKNENVILKQSEKIDVNYSEKIINGNYDFFDKKISKFLKHSFVKLRSNCYKAKNIVEYDREAYYLPYGNIRITFDTNLRTYNSDVNFNKISNSSISLLPNELNILEVKFSLPLPEHLKNILSKTIATRSAISKFVFGQKYVNFSPWSDNITEPF